MTKLKGCNLYLFSLKKKKEKKKREILICFLHLTRHMDGKDDQMRI